MLCRDDLFGRIDKAMFAELLRAISSPSAPLIEQAPDGTLLLGALGERITDHYEFYAVFQSPDEYRVEVGGKDIGRLSMELPRSPGDLFLLAGRRWRIERIDAPAKVISVLPSLGAAPPGFSGEAGGVHDVVANEMRAVLDEDDIPRFLDVSAADMLAQARLAYAPVRGPQVQWALENRKLLILPWVGHRKLRTLGGAFQGKGIEAGTDRLALIISADIRSLKAARELAANPPSAEEIALCVEPKMTEKFHPYLSEEMLLVETAINVVDVVDFSLMMDAIACVIGQVIE